MYVAASWRKRLDARLPPLGSRVRVSVPPCGFRGGRYGVWVGFSWGFSRFSLQQISFHNFSTLISYISFHFIRPCDGASGVVGRHPCYSRTYNMRASSHLIPRPDLALDTSWGYLFMYVCKVFCPEEGPSLDMHYHGSVYLSLLDKRKEWGSMSSPFLTEPVVLREYLAL